ncbi:MAG TPA: hypothetical protein VEL03_03360 [Streptosporangiaceae bacterium]|nr:hypothetical protein [Streptosporangiaceae bacterium]
MTERDEDGPELDSSGQDKQSGNGSIWEEAVRAEEDAGQRSAGDRARREGYDRPPGGSQGRGTSRPATDRRQVRPRQPGQGADVLSDFQRWLLRSSAKSMRREITGQVRKTLGGGRSDRGDVWDTATTEIPPEVGESPECQWCPVCRAARRMRESGTGLGDHLSTAGDAVAAAVHEAMRTFDSVLTRTTGPAQQQAPRRDAAGRAQGGAAWRDEAGSDARAADRDEWIAARDAWAAAHGALVADSAPAADADLNAARPGPPEELNAEPDGADEPDDRG